MRRLSLFIVVAFIAAAATTLVTLRDDDSGPLPRKSPSPEPIPTESSPEATPEETISVPDGFETYEGRAGYEFAYPAEWNVDEHGTAVQVSSPDNAIVFSVGVAPTGDIRAAIGLFLQQIEESYDVLEVRGPSGATVGDATGVEVAGRALNDANVKVEFDAFVVEGLSENFGIAVFSATSADDQAVDYILDSFSAGG